ncbi:ATP-sensitive inward rectifier potassium channel 11-like isoform X2 [Chrysoperla carnea]|uniref:ATP-sensitive inward rectifier potassium channel 11-like isoform X2 n=1 Tax=Chrysoperla carnea TaxID=189513 RepID=UPI001D060B5E|nr:ATP-sensitive inward rectifier potassium channel 11-like isoform X2 [Chrysoperla carnea]
MMRSSKSKDSSSTASTIDRKPVICRIGSGDEDSEDTNTEDDSKLFKPITISSNKMQKNNTYDRLSSTLIANRGISLPIQIVPRVPSLARVSTYGSGLNQPGSISGGIQSGQDSLTRRSFRYGAANRKIRKRAIFKNGDCNILQSRISRRRLRFLQDIFTTLVDTQWRWTLFVFALSFVGSWLGFAMLWWLIAFTHGDLEEHHLPDNQENSNWTPCITQIYSFTSCFLFSIETQHTIGYGSRSTTEECPEAVFVMCIQSIAGVMIQAFMVGIVFAKMTRPKHRTQTLLFSRNAVICQRDGQLCFMFRVGDMRKSHIIGASVRAQLIRSRSTKEGELLNQYQTELSLNADGCNADLFFIWPMTIVHIIDETSPLYNLSAADLLQERFEIVVILEGTIESTGQTTQARSSYVTSEILWGHRFECMVHYNKDRQGYEVDYSNFNQTIQVDTPLCSAHELHDFYRVQDDFRQVDPKESISFLQRSASMRR